MATIDPNWPRPIYLCGWAKYAAGAMLDVCAGGAVLMRDGWKVDGELITWVPTRSRILGIKSGTLLVVAQPDKDPGDDKYLTDIMDQWRAASTFAKPGAMLIMPLVREGGST